ncbi:hypothetical protein [Nocardioides mangrovi]|uniref:Uncharacterized protein n=1 Tax=Nocardioides mangrovi TaxID=2874580 RepID=A0ABS7UJL5_9ACTN|nr:hypothetical protein [Nocardioides mangrovi]MBZ5741218.1 hypothetical protein [Nocardioides mangrovi]
MSHSSSSTPSARVIRWRYGTAVQAARMLNRIATPRPCGPHAAAEAGARRTVSAPND